MAQLYINLPVTNLPQATAFYEALGFTKNTDFSNDDASAMIWDDTLSVMLLTPAFCANFLGKKTISDAHTTTEVLNALQFDSREAVDTFFDKAITAGGQKTIDAYDHGFMYGRDFEDLDGHIWEAFWMDASAMPKE
ncbi:MAG: VOC family protein [Candidatus Altimarinota bacterium]